jgi:Ca2+-binding RTX toxin-like protein
MAWPLLMACLKKLSYLETIMAIYNGTDGNDTITASEQRDTLEGYGGDDILMGLAGSDRLFGGTGNDWLSGGGSSDSLYGELGDDTLEGGEGSDHLYSKRSTFRFPILQKYCKKAGNYRTGCP